jgi:hypothetical protein
MSGTSSSTSAQSEQSTGAQSAEREHATPKSGVACDLVYLGRNPDARVAARIGGGEVTA